MVRFADNPEHGRIAAAKLVIRGTPAEPWEMAVLPGQDLRILGDREFYGFGVDAGMACFTTRRRLGRQGPSGTTG